MVDIPAGCLSACVAGGKCRAMPVRQLLVQPSVSQDPTTGRFAWRAVAADVSEYQWRELRRLLVHAGDGSGNPDCRFALRFYACSPRR